MTNDERQKRIEYLCEQIEVEREPSRVAAFARELSDLLEAKEMPPITSLETDQSDCTLTMKKDCGARKSEG